MLIKLGIIAAIIILGGMVFSNEIDTLFPSTSATVVNSLKDDVWFPEDGRTGLTSGNQGQSQEEYEPTEEDFNILLEIMDSDDDGLTDAEEKRLKTNPYNIDSDNDGLFDREEVRIYKTDPNDYDTDQDGYSDGSEVQNGYNPKGEGKLYEL